MTFITVVNWTCQRFNQIIKFISSLWRNFEFSHSLHLFEKDLEYIFSHSSCFSLFVLLQCQHSQFILLLCSNISKSSNLTWLDLSNTDILTTCFLLQLSNLEYLNLSQYEHLVDVDFVVIANCSSLCTERVQFWKTYERT